MEDLFLYSFQYNTFIQSLLDGSKTAMFSLFIAACVVVLSSMLDFLLVTVTFTVIYKVMFSQQGGICL